jgi:glycine/D-amino acid oxidase-like deaminating enzyme
VENPLAVDRSVDAAELARVQAFLGRHLPGVSSQAVGHVVCMYTMTPDEHFLVGLHPERANVAFVAGLSGHGFKFTPVLGEILAELSLERRTPQPIEFVSPGRFAR